MEDQDAAHWMVTSTSRVHCTSTEGIVGEGGALMGGASYHTLLSYSEGSMNATIPSLVLNPYAWNRIANMIFCESRAPMFIADCGLSTLIQNNHYARTYHESLEVDVGSTLLVHNPN